MQNINMSSKIIIYDRFIESFSKKLTKLVDLKIEKESVMLLRDFVMKH